MSPTAKFVLFAAAFVCFVVEVVRSRPGFNLIALGLALWVLVAAWTAAEAAF